MLKKVGVIEYAREFLRFIVMAIRKELDNLLALSVVEEVTFCTAHSVAVLSKSVIVRNMNMIKLTAQYMCIN